MKVCRICLYEKPTTEFYKHKNTKDNLRAECKECWNSLALKYYQDNKKALSEKRKDYYFKKSYGLTREDIEAKASEQNFRCEICNVEERLVVDHCHTTNQVRGLLCSKCNQGLGLFLENTKSFNNAIKYLEKYTHGH